ncbi:MAG: hypothetical protein IPK23_09325 [Rhizobiales bacterium]|nr:hypothetical protein [Hyphomicrobiales bacterium]
MDIFAIGDTNVFVASNSGVEFVFPNSDVSNFSNSPDLISSHGDEVVHFLSRLLPPASISLKIGHLKDPFVLIATDALAKWILSQPNTEQSLKKLARMSDPELRVCAGRTKRRPTGY